MTKSLIRSIGTFAFCWQQDTRRDFGCRCFAVIPSLAISLRQFASSARQNAKPPAMMPLPSKHPSISEPILCRSGQIKSFDCQPEIHSVNHESRGLFVAPHASSAVGRRRPPGPGPALRSPFVRTGRTGFCVTNSLLIVTFASWGRMVDGWFTAQPVDPLILIISGHPDRES